MIEDVFEGVFRMVGRFVGYFLFEIIFEILIKGTGHVIYKIFSNKDPEPESIAVTFLGVFFWLIVSALFYALYINL